MTLSRTFGSVRPVSAGKSAKTELFNNLGIYRFCIAFALIDYFDILDFIDLRDSPNATAKYFYAFVVMVFITWYFIRWKKIELSLAPAIFLLFFMITGLAFAANLFIQGTRQSYVTAFIGSLVYSLALFIPAGAVALDIQRLTRDLLLVFSIGAVFYLVEAIIKPLDLVSDLTFLHEVQIHKSLVLRACALPQHPYRSKKTRDFFSRRNARGTSSSSYVNLGVSASSVRTRCDRAAISCSWCAVCAGHVKLCDQHSDVDFGGERTAAALLFL